MSTRTARAGGDALAVLHTAAAGDYVMVGATGRVCRRRPGISCEVTGIGVHEHDTVHALLATRLLAVGAPCIVIADGAERRGHSLVLTRHGRRALHEAARTGRADR